MTRKSLASIILAVDAALAVLLIVLLVLTHG